MLRPTLFTLLLATLLLAHRATAQEQPDFVEFEKQKHNFGTIPEEQGKATTTFSFTNTYDEPVKLTYVKASCGCTTPDWTREPVHPGEEGIVTATYSTVRRPGKFNKNITVHIIPVSNINENNQPIDPNKRQVAYLRISGEVTPKPKTTSDFYPFVDGNLRFSTNHVAFGRLKHNEKKTRRLVVYNPGTEAITVEGTESPGTFALFEIQDGQYKIEPKESMIINVTYDPSAIDEWDFIHHRAYLNTNDPDNPRKNLYVSANIVEDFSQLTEEERQTAPRVTFNERAHNFGTITQGEVVSTTFELTNEGERPLKIRKIKSSCGCTATKPSSDEIAPGETETIEVTFNSAGKRNQVTKHITVVANDPLSPVTRLTIQAKVEVPQQAGQ